MVDRQPCAGGIVFDAGARLLLVRRGQAPSAGSWSVPGGRCLPGESPAAACVREVAEETGLRVEVVRYAGRVERAYRAALGRLPTERERELALRFVGAAASEQRQAAWERFYQALFACIDFRYIN